MDDAQEAKAKHPHCDELVLHAPTKCVYCDLYSERQAARIRDGIAFTGEPPTRGGPEKPCPSTQRRPLERINRWPGNTPRSKKDLPPGLEE